MVLVSHMTNCGFSYLNEIDSSAHFKSNHHWLPKIYNQEIGRWLQTCGGSKVICR